ncbi:MAG: alpha-ketoacid dehydrogenase subunit alpha/beta [Cyclonatronaceae bacterium]
MEQDNIFSTPQGRLQVYEHLLLPRRIEEKMLKLLRQNRISKWFSGMGQEGIAVGSGLALHPEDYVMSMHRNLGVFTSRGVPLYPLFCQLLGKKDGFSGGRERSFHFGSMPHRFVGMISHLAAMLPVGNGIALHHKLREESAAVLAFCGEGATSEGDFHEALNLAAVWELPIIFLVENNGYALSTPTHEQYRCKHIVDKAAGYGMESMLADGNNIGEMYDVVSRARRYVVEQQKPMLIEATTFRLRGHEEASGTSYVPDELMQAWAKKDPVVLMQGWLQEEGILDEALDKKFKEQADARFLPALQKALDAPPPDFNEATETQRIFAPYVPKPAAAAEVKDDAPRSLRFVDGVKEALHFTMKQDERALLMGQDIAEYGGVFKATQGFAEEFGRARVRNTPIIESGIIGAGIGLALTGWKPIIEMQFADFISCGFNQIVNNVAKSHYRWSPPLNITIRAPHGAGVQAGPFHSQSPESWFMQHPGLKIVVPSSVEDAYHLLYSSIQDPNPVLFFEHKALYRSLKADISGPPAAEALGRATVVEEGDGLSIITYGMGVHWAKETQAFLEEEYGARAEIVDLRTLMPLDMETVAGSVRKTGRVLLLEEASGVLGPMSEIAARLAETCFEALDAPITRCSSLYTPIPVSKPLEDGYLASYRLRKKLRQVMEY